MVANVAKKCMPLHEVEAIRDRVRREGISDGQLADMLGCSRTHVNQMFNHAAPMRIVYRWAIIAIIAELRRNAASQLP